MLHITYNYALHTLCGAPHNICNDEGKIGGLEYNRALRDEEGTVYDIICGPFFVCGLGKDGFASLSEQLTETYAKRFAHPELFIRVGGSLLVLSA